MMYFVVRKYYFSSICNLSIKWPHPDYTSGFALIFAAVEMCDQYIYYDNVKNIHSACTNELFVFSVSRFVPVLSEHPEIRLRKLNGSIFQLSLYLAVTDRHQSL